jgi:phage gp29-like protein
MDVEFVEGGKGKSGDFLDSINYWDRIISKAILGGTLTSQADGKSSTNALGDVHNEVRMELIDADAKQIAGTLTRDIVIPLQMFNGLVLNGRYAHFEFNLIENIDQKSIVEVLDKGVQIGMKIPVAWAHKKLQIPMATEKDEVLTQTQLIPIIPNQVATTRQHGCQCPSCKTSALKSTPEPKAPSDILADKLNKDIAPDMDKWLDTIESMLNQADSLEHFKEMLLAAYSDLDDSAMAEKIGMALTAANLAGQFDAEAQSE